MASPPITLSCLCRGSNHFTNVFNYDSPPKGEIRFEFGSSGLYRREVWRCNLCGHFISIHEMDIGKLYSDDYVSSNYEDQEGVARNFKRIISLPPSQSDNTGRVQRILGFATSHFAHSPQKSSLTILDVGSGLGVFPYTIKAKNSLYLRYPSIVFYPVETIIFHSINFTSRRI